MYGPHGCCCDCAECRAPYVPPPPPSRWQKFKKFVSWIMPWNVYRRWRWSRSFRRVVFPVMKRVYPALIANDIVSVQPMSQPSGLLFYIDIDYEYAGVVGPSVSKSGSLE